MVFLVVGTVVQFVDFSLNIFARSKEVFRNDDTEINVQLQDLAQDLLELGTKLRRPLQLQSASANTDSAEEQRLQDICNSCSKMSQDMIDRLKSLRPPEKKKAWKSVLQALLIAWSEEEVIYPTSPEAISVLLKHGAKPNKPFKALSSVEYTPWGRALSDALKCLKHAAGCFRC